MAALPANVAPGNFPGVGAELVTVAVGEQQYAIDIMAVREIRGSSRSTPMPNAPAHFLGMINLRGVILPVLDLGARLGFGPSDQAQASVVVVVQIGARQVGLLVDGVRDIVVVTEGMIQPTPDIGADGVNDFVQGVMITEHGIISLLSLDNIVPPEEAAEAAQAA